MGNFTIQKWACDRCGVVMDKRPPHPGIRVSVTASEDYETAGGQKFKWAEMCNQCNKDVRHELDAMAETASRARALTKDTSDE